MEEMLDFIGKNIGSFSDDRALVSDNAKAYDINKNNFYPVSSWESSKPIAFIDGGSSVFIQSPSLCVGFIRVVCVLMVKKKTIRTITNELYCVSSAHNEGDKIIYRNKYFRAKNSRWCIPDTKLDSLDPSITNGIERFPLQNMINIARRFLELDLAAEAIDFTDEDGIVVLDGNLRACYPGEEDRLNKLYEKAKEKNVLVSALSKTSNTITTKGDTLNAALFNSTELEQWYYHPAYVPMSKEHKAEVFFVRLHKLSKYIFTVDVQKDQAGEADMEKVLGFFAYYSRDAAFPGYLYGLVKADLLARVSNRETEMLLTRFSSMNPSLFNLIKPYISCLDAHSVLDNMG